MYKALLLKSSYILTNFFITTIWITYTRHHQRSFPTTTVAFSLSIVLNRILKVCDIGLWIIWPLTTIVVGCFFAFCITKIVWCTLTNYFTVDVDQKFVTYLICFKQIDEFRILSWITLFYYCRNVTPCKYQKYVKLNLERF